jgi:5-methylcytosine-specific restriction endonuclease McrA
MYKKTYQQLLENNKWKIKADSIRARDNNECQNCGIKDVSLHVHHKRYYKNQPPWIMEDEYLITLCQHCHHKEHEDKDIKEFQYIGKNRQKKLDKKNKPKRNRSNIGVVFSKPYQPKQKLNK